MNMEEFRKHNEKVRQKGIIMSRVPEKTREFFVNLANEEFCGDYGLFLKWCLEEAIEYQKVKKIILDENKIKEVLK